MNAAYADTSSAKQLFLLSLCAVDRQGVAWGVAPPASFKLRARFPLQLQKLGWRSFNELLSEKSNWLARAGKAQIAPKQCA